MRCKSVSYNHLSPAEKDLLDFIMAGNYLNRNYIVCAARRFNVCRRTIKGRMKSIADVYSVDSKRHSRTVRLIYLRAIELGLMYAWQGVK